ncbi:histidine phosphatase family protein [Janthinobacterium psychrotolerans]|uniref:Alpha-ribazole phosphatase n=1 Tax=Janthinobacterium psychrotolerans TaxID=1747903 RepID=A0A1A7C2E1_9BURK|nr:histidine phosphatase family protein [Janthinobacterium psychrotolerans]OBV39184.1 alpha-ribazole phosphatase [Janthinobacterium psychrotolerans]
MRLILVRHPQPDVASGICYGSSDVAVAPHILAAARAGLRASLPANIPLYTSPLSRCADLASQLAGDLQASYYTHDARLMEMDFGDWELRAWHDIDRDAIDAWALDLAQYRPGGGENVLAMAARVAAFLDELLREQHAAVIIICHAGTMRLLSALQAGLPLMETALLAATSAHKIAYGAVLALDFQRPIVTPAV